MEIKITTNQTLAVLQVVSWIIFIGLCIEAGGLAVNTFITLFINPARVVHFWEGSGYFAALYQSDPGHFVVITACMLIVAVLKAIMFYQIVMVFTKKKLRLSQPFSPALQKFILLQGYLALGIGLFSQSGYEYAGWLSEQGLPMADLQALHIAGADVWLFMAVMLFVIVQLVKRGIELQQENDLTI